MTHHVIVAYVYAPGMGHPFRGLTIDTHAQDLRRVLVKTARQRFGDDATVCVRPEKNVCDKEGRPIYGPTGSEVWLGGMHYAVWRRNLLVGFISSYHREG